MTGDKISVPVLDAVWSRGHEGAQIGLTTVAEALCDVNLSFYTARQDKTSHDKP